MILIAESPSRRTEYRRYLGNAGLNVVALSPDQDVATAELGRFLVLFERLVSETELWMANTPPEKLDWVPIDTPQVRFGDRLTKVTIKSLYVHMAVAEHKWSHDLSVCGDGETLQLPRDPKLAERATQGDFMANAREMHRQDMDILSALPEDQLAKRMTFAGDDSQWTVMGFLWGMWGHRAYHLGNLDSLEIAPRRFSNQAWACSALTAHLPEPLPSGE